MSLEDFIELNRGGPKGFRA